MPFLKQSMHARVEALDAMHKRIAHADHIKQEIMQLLDHQKNVYEDLLAKVDRWSFDRQTQHDTQEELRKKIIKNLETKYFHRSEHVALMQTHKYIIPQILAAVEHNARDLFKSSEARKKYNQSVINILKEHHV